MKKDNRDIEKRIKKEAEKSTPDIWEGVEKEIKNGKGEVITLPAKKRKFKARSIISSVAAALVLISAAIFGIVNYNRIDGNVVSTVYLEVNPQIELSLNAYDKVIKATAKNEDGKKVLGSMKLKGNTVDVAFNAILGSMYKNGYLTNEANSVLISVENEDTKRAEDIQKIILNGIRNSDNKGFNVAAVVQKAKYSDDIKKTAEELHITPGKAEFIERIQKKGVKASKEDLAKFSVHELNLIFQSLRTHDVHEFKNDEIFGGLSYNGIATDTKYISIDKVKEIVFKEAKVKEENATFFEAELDFEYGKMIYEVEFKVGSIEYDYELDAITGELYKSLSVTPKPIFVTGDSSVSSKPATSSDNSVTSNISSDKNDAVITSEKALEIALSHAGVDKSSVREVETEFDSEANEASHYDIEFKSNGHEYEYEIDAINGNVIKNNKGFDD